jgi:hypothetical protein
MSRRYKVIATAAVVVGVGLASVAVAQTQVSRDGLIQMGLGEVTEAIGQGCGTALGDDSRGLTEDQMEQLANNCAQAVTPASAPAAQ